MAAAVSYKIGRNTPVPVQVLVDGVAQSVAGKAIEVVLRNGQAVVRLSNGAGVTLGPQPHEFTYTVSTANLTALGLDEPGVCQTTLNIFNADGTLFMDGADAIEVKF